MRSAFSTVLVLVSATALLVGAWAVLGQDVQVTASVSADTVGTQDQLEFIITISGKDAGEAENPRVSRFRGFQVVAGPNVSTQFQWINGRASSSKSFTYILLPEKEGQHTIDPVEVRVGGRTYRTQPISVRVIPDSNRPSTPRKQPPVPSADDDFPVRRSRADGDVFVTAELDRSTAYPGEQVTLSYHLYTQVAVTGLQLQDSPPLTGFWVEDLEVSPNPMGTRKVVNGKEYLEYIVKKQALFPNAPGWLKIAPSTFAISAKVGGDFFGIFGQTETIHRKTKEIFIDVKPLPDQNRPPNFTNAVGSFNLTSNLDKGQAATGEAVTFRVQLSGRGNLKVVPDIALPPLPDFTVYSSKSTQNVRAFEGDRIGGDKSWEYVLVPKAPGLQTIPPISIAYFDPQQEKYETLTTPLHTLNVIRGTDSGGAAIVLSGIGKQNLTRQGSDINFIKLSTADLEGRQEPIYRSRWFYGLALIALAFNAGAFLYQRERSKQSANAALFRSRKARSTALKRLKQAAKAGRADPRRFYDECAMALSGYLADKFSLPEIAVAGDTLERTLSERSVALETVKETLSCLEECDFGRFVSASQAPEKMQEITRRIRKIVDTLDRT